MSVVIPVYRSAPLLPELVERLKNTLEARTSSWEIVFVDDASPDGSFDLLLEMRQRDPRIRIIQLARNHGQQRAVLCGLNYTRGHAVVTMDDDLQHPPEEIPKLLAALAEGHAAVIGRITEKQHAWWRNLGARLNQYLAGRILGKPRHLYLSSFRALSRFAVERIVRYKGVHPHIAALLLKSVPMGRIANVDVAHAPRPGKSTYTLGKLLMTGSYLLINHSYIPLRLMIVWGLALSLLSMGFAAYVLVYVWLYGSQMPGWPSLAVLVAFLGGNILMALGIVGEYLGRLVEEASATEQFAVFREEG